MELVPDRAQLCISIPVLLAMDVPHSPILCIFQLSSIIDNTKGEGKAHPRTGHESPEVEKYSSTLSLTSALDAGGWSTPRPVALPPGNTRYPLYRRLSRPQNRSGRMRKTSPTPGFDPRTVQPVASCYTD
jgi:hypothetical protein